jgi:hypothetical protein
MKSQRAKTLANQFDGLNREVMAFVETCPAALWQQPCHNDGRSVAVVAYHIASSHDMIAKLVGLVAQAQPLPALTMDALHQANAQQAKQFANCTQAEVLDLLRTNGAEATTLVNELSDEQLDRSAYISLFAANMNTQQVIESVLIGHASGHLANLQATAAA